MDEYFEITSKVMETHITFDEIDSILDKHIDKEEVSEDDGEIIVLYILQLFYRSGRYKTNTDEIHEKYNNLIADRAIQLMKDMGIMEETFDVEKQEYVYFFNEKEFK